MEGKYAEFSNYNVMGPESTTLVSESLLFVKFKLCLMNQHTRAKRFALIAPLNSSLLRQIVPCSQEESILWVFFLDKHILRQ